MTDADELRSIIRDEIRAAIADAMPAPREPEPEPAPPKLHPHRVKAKLTEQRTDRIRTYDRDRAPAGALEGAETIDGERVLWWEFDETNTYYIGPDQCPDCGLGLYSTGDAAVCMRLRPADPESAAHRVRGSGGVVACGLRE